MLPPAHDGLLARVEGEHRPLLEAVLPARLTDEPALGRVLMDLLLRRSEVGGRSLAGLVAPQDNALSGPGDIDVAHGVAVNLVGLDGR